MTTAFRIVNVGNTAGDKIRVETPADIIEIERGEMSPKLGAQSPPYAYQISGEHGKGDYLGEPEVVVRDDHTHDFGWALWHLKEGKRVTRPGWHGKGMWLYLEPWDASVYLDEGSPRFQPCIVMRTAEGTMQPGWLASQADMLAEDWRLVE